MGFWKMTSLLALGIVVLIHMSPLQASPVSNDVETTPDPEFTPEEEEILSRLAEKVKAYTLMMEADEMLQDEEDTSVTVQKRACNTPTCLLHRMIGTVSANQYGGRSYLLPYSMGFKVFGGRRKFRKN